MSGQNESLYDLPPGMNRTSTQYAAGRTWWKGNLIRWIQRVLTPIGGWVKYTETPLASTPGAEPIRSTYSWRDLLKAPWAAYGSANKLWGVRVNSSGSSTFYDITPAALGYNPGGKSGYGSGPYGVGPYGISPSGGTDLDSTAVWSFDNFGKMLVAVSSQDGRLIIWDPATPTVEAVAVGEAPVDNTLVVVTDEEFLMVMGGKNNPRRVKWASRRTYTDWVATEVNSAGGFDLQSNGAIIAACNVPGGVLVLTDTDAHLVEYVGAPYYYGRRRISTECEVVSINSVFPVSFGAIWLGKGSFWIYNGAVSRLLSSVDYDVFYNSRLSEAHLVHGGINQHNQEVWWFYPDDASAEPNRYVAYSYNKDELNYWTVGEMTRTAWLNPIWQDKPIGIYNQTLYLQETGDSADGALRNVYAETGAMDIAEGTNTFRIDRVYPDLVSRSVAPRSIADLTVTFKCQMAPNANVVQYGPVSLNSETGYVPVRMRARQISMRIDETAPSAWAMGKFRIRVKSAGAR